MKSCQGSMAIQLTDANLVVWTLKDMAVVHVKYDEDF